MIFSACRYGHLGRTATRNGANLSGTSCDVRYRSGAARDADVAEAGLPAGSGRIAPS